MKEGWTRGKEVQDNEGRMDETKEGGAENGVRIMVGFCLLVGWLVVDLYCKVTKYTQC